MPRVLVVDDCADTTANLCALLCLWGHDARAANDGPSALSQAADFQPDVVLLDLAMPGMDGHEVAGRLRALPDLGDAFLIALSGYAYGRGLLAPEGHFDFCLLKPVEPVELRRLLSYLGTPPAYSESLPAMGFDAAAAG